MNRLFRTTKPGLKGYAGLVLFAVAYLAVMALILAPGSILNGQGTETAGSAQGS